MHLETPSAKLQQLVDEKPHAYLYVSLAKIGLWVTAILLFGVMGAALFYSGGSMPTLEAEKVALLGVAVQAGQVLAVISITVLGYHGYKGTHLLHTLRHWGDE